MIGFVCTACWRYQRHTDDAGRCERCDAPMTTTQGVRATVVRRAREERHMWKAAKRREETP